MVENWLHVFPELEAMDEVGKHRLIRNAKLNDVLPNQPIVRRGDPCDHYLLVIAGCIRVQVSSETGREIVLYRVHSGETCVINTASLFAGSDYVADAVTEAPTRTATLPAAVFKGLISESPIFRDFVLREHGVRLIEIVATLEDITFVRFECRLASILLKFCEGKDEVVRTHQELAAEVGSSREVVSRCLKDFERRGWVKVGRGAVTLIDKPALDWLLSSSSCSSVVAA